jgi:hypothetical protein
MLNLTNPIQYKTKKCCHCKQEKHLTCFYKNKLTKDGLHKVCKTCKNE